MEAIKDWNEAYNNMGSVENGERFLELWPQVAAEFRESVDHQVDIAYGEADRNRFDLFHPEGESKGLFVFVHGGYWLRFEKSFWSHLAKGPLSKGWTVAMPSYTLCPDARISDITREVASAINCAAEKVEGPIVLCGHSAGGHLVTRQICQDTGLYPQTINRVQRVISISGLHDLRPILKIDHNITLSLDEAEAIDESPALLNPVPNIAVDCLVGADELPEFVRQNDLLANIWRGIGVETSSIHLPGKNHFDVIDDLESSEGIVTRLLD